MRELKLLVELSKEDGLIMAPILPLQNGLFFAKWSFIIGFLVIVSILMGFLL